MDASSSSGSASPSDVALQDGQVLCRVANAIKPGAVAKVSTSRMAFHQLNNLTEFLRAAKGLGVPASELCDTLDLHEGKDLNAVVNCVLALSDATGIGRTRATQRPANAAP